ncbi:zinc finger ZZ-type and EF-hand domain-containing protein 1-like isoform X2 [Halichondria panicea]|uniref:zinc finger ZZ-type and EF-hand domain-containing protein 1-like isoform X2 n=1 Tax=Halichondria panicea TaxID=6063 RepID=UPI00312B64A5
MGNTTSAESIEDDLSFLEQLPLEEAVSGANENLLDLSPLFVVESLHKALLNIKEPPGSPLVMYKEQLVKWLHDKVDKMESIVGMGEFVNFLTGKGCDLAEATTCFQELDTEGEGGTDITYCLAVLKNNNVRELLPCPRLPGLMDLYSPERTDSFSLHKELLKYLVRYRVGSDKLVLPSLTQINSSLEQRMKLVAGRCIMIDEKEKELELLGGGADTEEDEGTERLVLSKCYSKVQVSSGEKKIDALFDNSIDTYWQSNGSPRSHYIRVRLLSGVMIQELAVSVRSGDDSYMPKAISISVGNSESSLKEIKTIQIPRQVNGRHVLMRSISSNYSIIQLNIKSCHSDGCDCRIRGLHIKGCRYKREIEPSLMDTMAIWYLNIVACTAKAAIPLSPALRDTILQQSKMSLKSLSPLSLSPTSPLKPDFFSTFVIAEMDKFLTSLCLPEETYVSVGADPLHVLLSFALAHGNVNTILDTLQILIDNTTLEFSLLPLLKKMEEMKSTKKQRHSELLKLEVVSCDGGQKDEEHGPTCILSNTPDNSSGDPYISDKDKKVVNILLKEESSSVIQLSMLKVKVQSGAQGARAGLVFLLTSEPKDLEDLAKQTEKYDNWTMDDYTEMRSQSSESTDELCPVAYFEPNKDSCLAEVTPNAGKPAKYVLLKFLASDKEDVERVGVHCVRVCGHKILSDGPGIDSFLEKLDSIAPLTDEPCVLGGVVLIRVLGFLATLLADLHFLQLRRKAAALDPTLVGEVHLAVDNLSLEKIWNIYIPLTLNPEPQAEYASILCLHLLKSALPFIKPSRPTSNKLTSVPSEVLSHLCGILDSAEIDSAVKSVAQDIIVEGVVIFFPDAKARKEYLLSMIGAVLDENQPKSWWLKFEALCHYFSKTDSNSVLNLPKTLSETTPLDPTPTLNILTTMLTVATREAQNIIVTGTSKPDDLVKLLSALQASLLIWCQRMFKASEEEEVKKTVYNLLAEYVTRLVQSCTELLHKLDQLEEVSDSLLEILRKSLLGRPLPEMLVFLATMTDSGGMNPVNLSNRLHPLVPALSNIVNKVPSILLKVDSPELLSCNTPESVVSVWTRESPHNYENNSDKTEDFVCSSATRFVVEFDQRCHTERRYDYLEFTDTQGSKTKFDGECGSDRWTKKAEFKGQKLTFKFHSDGSNNEWGYKFTLKAYGVSPPSMHWILDAQISLSSLLGLLSSTTLGKKRTERPITSPDKTDQEKEEEKLVDSELWKTLFRGGYMVGKLTRSLSEFHAASPADSALCTMLQDLANGPEGVGLQLLELCRADTKGHFYGGPTVDKAVNSVFAALIWHSQDIREELLPFVSEENPPKVTPGVLTAFKAAEAMRRDLVEARQQVMQSNEEGKEEEANKEKEKIDEDAPVTACFEKAMFLLKFSGLSRRKNPLSTSGSRPQWARKSLKWQKVTTAVSTVGVLKQHLTSSEEKVSEKYPSFDLILNFVKNEALSVDRVQALLKQREKVARSVAETYAFLAEVVTVMGMGNLFELSGLVLLQQVLSKQQLFPRHYAAKLDGCGLELENQVRKSYRRLLTKLVETINSFKKPSSKEHSFSRSLVLLFVCHLLDFDWQDYDHALLSELQLPEFLFSNAVEYSVTGDREPMEKFEGEDEMLEKYEVYMKMLQLFNDLPSSQSWKEMLEMPYCMEHLKDTHIFLVAMSLYSDRISMNCDNCSSTIRGRWFRDTEVEEDYDLCTSCFDNEDGREKSADHKFMSLGRYGCDICHMAVMGHRFHSETRCDYDLCIGCFRKEQATGRDDSWTVFPYTEMTPSGQRGRYWSSDKGEVTGFKYQDGYLFKSTPASQVRGYVHQHCWMLFSSLCLGMANTVNKPVLELDYLQQASRIKYSCLKHLSVSLRAAVLDQHDQASKRKADKKIEEEEKTKEESKQEGADQSEQASPVDQSKEGTSIDQSKEGTSVDETDFSVPSEATPTTAEATLTIEDITTSVVTPTGDSKEEEEESPIVKASKRPQDMDSNIGFNERNFSTCYMDSILGLLTAVLPKEFNLSAWIQHKQDIEVFLAEELLPSLLQLSSCCEVTSPLRLQALLVAAQYFARLNPQVADRAVEIAEGQTPHSLQLETGCAGLKTVQFFFNCGASSLERSDFTGASTAESCLLLLSRPLPWRPALSATIATTLGIGLENMDLSSMFSLLILAGFPKVPRAGSLLTYTGSGDLPSPVVLLKVEESGRGCAVNLKTREKIVAKLSDYEIEESAPDCIDTSKMDTILPLVKAALKSVKPDTERCVENVWILGLSLKALYIILQSPESEGVVKMLVDMGIVPAIMKLASRPTNFSLKWRLAELEVLGMSMYQPAGAVQDTDSDETTEEEPTAAAATEGSKEDKDEPASDDKDEDDEDNDDETKNNAKILEGLSEEVCSMLQTLSEVFMCPMTVLRAMHESVDGNMDRFMAITEQSYSEGEFKPSDEILEAAKKWEIKKVSDSVTVESVQQSTEDVGVTRLVPVEIDIKSVEAIAEDQSIFKKTKNLLKSDSKEEEPKNSSAARQESYSLLSDELTSLKNKPPSRSTMYKTFYAIAVLQARRVLSRLLVKWADTGMRLSTSSLGCTDMPQYFCLLDLLVKQEGEEILSSVLSCTEPTELISLVLTAVQCMSEVSVGKETRVIKYTQDSNMKETGKINIPNAANLNITFHPINGSLKFSSSINLSQNAKSHTSTTFDPEDRQSHVIPGDTLYYEVDMVGPSNKNTTCTFTVNGTQMGRFDTGHSILEQLLCRDSAPIPAPSLPLSRLWPLLIVVACKYTGAQRLKVVKLLMRLVGLQSSGRSEGGDTVVVSKDRLELSALKPLWQLYTTLIKTYEEKTKGQQLLSPEIIRVFTELFLTIENLAEEWGISHDLMIRTITKEELNKWLEKGIANVAFVSLALGLDNTAAAAFIKAKSEYVPPPPTAKHSWEGAVSDDGGGSEDTDSFDNTEEEEDSSSSSDSDW